MASVFDVERVKWCEKIGMKRYKIASWRIYDKELVDAVAAMGNDIIVSLCMYREKGFPRIKTRGKVDFLYCVAKYHTLPEDLHFRDVDFNKYFGFSDYIIGIEAALVAAARGARIIEKHFTPEKMYGPDHAGSMELDELRKLAQLSGKFETTMKSR